MATTEECRIFMLLLERWDWAIDAYRGYLNASFPRNDTLTLCVIVFLTVSEVTRLYYARYPPEGLQAGAGDIGQNIFRVVSVVPVLGVMVIRTIETFTVSHSITLTVCVAVISTMAIEAPPSVMDFYRRVKFWIGRWRQEGVDVERGPEQIVGLDDSRPASIQARLLSIYDTLQSIVHNSVFLCLILNSVYGVACAVVTNLIGLLEQSVRAAHRRLRGGDGPARGRNDVRLQDIEST